MPISWSSNHTWYHTIQVQQYWLYMQYLAPGATAVFRSMLFNIKIQRQHASQRTVNVQCSTWGIFITWWFEGAGGWNRTSTFVNKKENSPRLRISAYEKSHCFSAECSAKMLKKCPVRRKGWPTSLRDYSSYYRYTWYTEHTKCKHMLAVGTTPKSQQATGSNSNLHECLHGAV